MTIYLPPSIRQFEPKRIVFSTWIDHLPFGYDIVEAVGPELLVELGTYSGLSYFTFCQSIREHDIDALCYAVDTWKGDEHTDSYDESVYNEVAQYNREHYFGFSYLLRMLFNEALDHFSDETIDLLHLDGFHTYDAVREDFHNWYPKMKPGGIMLFHDIAARIKDFGAWKFWEEYAPKYESFSFIHGFGLGVIRKPGGPEKEADLLKILFSGDPDSQKKIREFYTHACRFHNMKRKLGSGVFGKVRKPKAEKPETRELKS